MASWVAEQARAGAGSMMVVVSNPACYEFIFPTSETKFSGELVAGTPSAKFPVLVPVATVDTAYSLTVCTLAIACYHCTTPTITIE